jgi:hypothetical protein
MHSVWQVDRETKQREFVAVFKDREMAELFADEFVETDHTTWEIDYMEPGEGR